MKIVTIKEFFRSARTVLSSQMVKKMLWSRGARRWRAAFKTSAVNPSNPGDVIFQVQYSYITSSRVGGSSSSRWRSCCVMY